LAIRFVDGTERLQDSDHSGDVLRGITQKPAVNSRIRHGGPPALPSYI
jgi:hypothetical protein